MRIALIQPAMGREGDEYVASWKMEPLSMAALAGLTPPEHSVTFWDDRTEAIPYDDPVDLAAISVETYTARRAYQIARQYQRRGVPVVMGGYHASLVPDETAQFADAILVGEAEDIWPQMVADAAAGKLKPRYTAPGRPNLLHRMPDRRIFRGKRYLPLTLVESGRGCRFACDFCSIASFYGSTFEPRAPQDVATEIAATGRKWVFLVDDNFTADFDRAKALCRALIPQKIRWISQATINTARDPEMMDLLQKSGCAALLIGFESLSSANLKAMNKTFNQGVENYRESLKRFQERGIKIYATFVFGYDTDTPDLYRRTLDFALENDFFLAAFNHLQPFPGTPLYRRMEAEGRLLYDRWWLEPDYRFGQLVFQPSGISKHELYERLQGMRREFYSVRNIALRARNWKANLLGPGPGWLYLLSNWMLRKELDEKWVTPLGDLREPDPC